jgi:hypothetical protein
VSRWHSLDWRFLHAWRLEQPTGAVSTSTMLSLDDANQRG